MLLLILLLALRYSGLDTCPIYCQCYSAFDGYHVTCQNAKLYEIPFNLTKFLQTTEHQNLIVDLSSNFLSIIPCHFFQISTIITLILTKNQIQFLPSCFSQSSIENLFLNENSLQFNQTTILSSSKLIHLDLSNNKISSLPRTFFFYLRRLRRLILNGEEDLFALNNDQWIRSLTTRNQLTIIICNEYFHLPLCLFDNLFQTKKLLSLELNRKISCDCSFVYLPIEKIHFHYCQTEQQSEGICHLESSRFERGQSWIHVQNQKYRQICAEEYQNCQNRPMKTNDRLTTHDFNLPFIKNSSISTTIGTITFSKKENMTAGAIISFILVLLIVTIVCLYVILSGHILKKKHRRKITNLISRKKKQQDISNVNSIENPIPIENINMNSNQQKSSIPRTNSYSDEESDLTFYSINDNHHSSTTFVQSSITEIEIASLTSTIDSSLSHETVIIANRNKPRIY